MESNEVIIILAHCDNNHKLEILEECIDLCKKQNKKIIISTNYKLPEEIYDKVDYIVYEKENRLIYHYENIPSGYSFFINFPTYWHIQRVEYDISYAALQLIKNGLSVSIQKGFAKSHFVNYDYLMREENFFEKYTSSLGLEHDAISYYFCHEFFFNSGMFSVINKTFSEILEPVNNVYDYGKLHHDTIMYNGNNGVLEGVLDYLFYKNNLKYLKVKEEELDAEINDFNKLCIFSRNHFIENTDIEVYKSTDGLDYYLTFIVFENEKSDIVEIKDGNRIIQIKFKEIVEYIYSITGLQLFMLKLPDDLIHKDITISVPGKGSKLIKSVYNTASCQIHDKRIVYEVDAVYFNYVKLDNSLCFTDESKKKYTIDEYCYSDIKRWDLINFIANEYNSTDYLEIGVNDGICIRQINVLNRDGVDPSPASESGGVTNVPEINYEITSDDFFQNHAYKKYDIIFIDGLHHCSQVDKDIENSLKYLKEDGFIFLHDCNPPVYEMQIVPRQQGLWNGDVWKSIVKLRCTNPNLEMSVVDTDWGVGVIKKGHQNIYDKETLEKCLDWNYFDNNREELLNIITVDDFFYKYKNRIKQN